MISLVCCTLCESIFFNNLFCGTCSLTPLFPHRHLENTSTFFFFEKKPNLCFNKTKHTVQTQNTSFVSNADRCCLKRNTPTIYQTVIKSHRPVICNIIYRPSCTTCILRTKRLGYSPKNACHLSSSTAKQQRPHENNENAFKGAKHSHAELRIYTCTGSSMCIVTLPFVFWELILASIPKPFKHDFLKCFPSLVLRGAP